MRKVTRAKGNIKGRRAIIEAVEQRTLLSGATIANGVLTVTGTSQQDVIVINFVSDFDGGFSVKINGNITNLSATGVQELLVNGEAGNDSININTGAQFNTGEQATSVVVNDGDGNDSIELDLPQSVDGTSVTSKITAGNGNDNVFVQAGTSSTVILGNGNDTVSGSASEDNLVMTVNAGNGNDQINGVSAGDASLQLQAVVGTGHDTFNNNNDPDIDVLASTSDGQSPFATGGFIDFTGVVSESTPTGLKPLADATVFVDTNANGILDSGELSTITDLSGDYDLDLIPSNGGDPATYNVRVIEPGYTSTPLAHTENAQPGEGFSGEDFIFPTVTTATATNPTLFGTAGSYNNQGNTIANAVDGNLSTFFDSPTPSGGFVALDYGLPQTIKQISFTPRSTLPGRMVGGLFQGSNSPNFSNAVTLYTVTTAPAVNKLTTVNISNTSAFRYVRYLGPANSYSNIAEMKFTIATNLTGTIIGTAGSYHSQGNTAAHAFDGNLSTFFDAPDATGDWAGQDLGTAKVITQISYAPRSGWASRMVGGMFQASNSADFSSGVVTLYTVTAVPATGVLTTVQIVNFSAYRYVRYMGPANSYSNIAEAQFSGSAAVSGTFLQSRGTLVIDGTSNADTITLDVASVDTSEPNPDTVTATVNGVVQTFPLADVLQIVINAGAGNDTVTLTGFDEGPNDITDHGYEAITVNGGDGNDTITTNIMVQEISIGEPFLIDGGSGDDTLFDGGDGIATIIGGDGNDSFGSIGFPGLIVSVYGGDGNDTVFTDGDTTLAVYDGGAGVNTLDTTRNLAPTSNARGVGLSQYVNVHNLVLGDQTDVTVTGTSGDDTITGIDLGGINVSITGGGGNDTDNITGVDNITIDDSGPGADNITVAVASVVNVIGGNGNDTFHVRNNNGPVTVDGGPGINTAYTDPGATVKNIQILNPDQTHTKLTGTVIGTPGSYRNHGTTIANVFDNNLTTFFDAPDASGDWVGVDLASPQIVTQVKYAPRAGWESRMVGGEIQASNTANFSSGVVTLFTVSSTPTAGVLTTQSLTNTTAYRYYRYIGPANSYCDIAELEFDS